MVPVPAGAVAVIDVGLLTVKVVAAVAPKFTAVAAVKLVPVIVTVVPPVAGPAVGLIDVTVGTATYVNWSAAKVADVPPPVVTVTSTVPAAWAGLVAVIWVLLLTVTPVAGVPPKLTAVAPVKSTPVIVTAVPPMVGPWFGATLETTGGGMTTTFVVPAADVQPVVVTVTE
jgi:hypothetical protein